MSYDKLIDWSNHEARPAWQQDALRRIAISGKLNNEDLAELQRIIEKESHLTDEDAPAVIPLDAGHLSDSATVAPRTILGSIGPVRGVDRLASDQPPIKFASEGVTLIYGANGSGKSGYCRIVKQLCRSTGLQDIKGNVYEEVSSKRQEVDLVFGVAKSGSRRRKVTWCVGESPPQELARISVFDAGVARVYIDENRKVKFLPYELNILNQLANAAQFLDNELKGREEALTNEIASPLPKGYTEGTSVAQALEKLNVRTKRADLPSEEGLRALAVWNEDKVAELQQTNDAIRDDPKAQLLTHKSVKQELEHTKSEITTNFALLGDEGIAKLVEAYGDMVRTTEVAEIAARGIGGDMPIQKIGTKSWRQMLVYAREFAGETFLEHDEPRLATGEICVLCQQPLDDSASKRMVKFDHYILDRAAMDSKSASEKYERLVGSIKAINVITPQQVEGRLGKFGEMNEMRGALVKEISNAFELLGVRHKSIRNMIEEVSFRKVEKFTPLATDLVERIDADIADIDERSKALEETDTDAKHWADLNSKKIGLEDAKRLSEDIDVVVKRLNHVVERLRVKDARAQCASGPIATMLTTRRRAVLTDSLKAKLADEMRGLELSNIPIDLSDRSRGGDSLVEVGLDTKQSVSSNSDVLSEGEQRTLALSCFLAELNEVGTEHGIIIDDPVSSLDHSRMRAVAKRLVAEAVAGRQVIIFTHNITFHHMMNNEARRARVPFHPEWMSSQGGMKFGVIDDSGKPSHMKRAKQRLNDIEMRKAQMFKNGYDPEKSKYRDSLVAIYTLMRETWERIVEEILFNGSIQRFRQEIMTQSLEHASYDPKEDYSPIFEGMKRCSHYSGHDKALDLPEDLPSREEIEADQQALTDFHEKVISRRTGLERGRRYVDGVEPKFL